MEPVIAIDVAILPPPDLSKTAIQLSALLPISESQGLRLDATHLPHITLTQQFVHATEMHLVTEYIASVLRRHAPLPLSIVGPGRGSSSVWMQVGCSPELIDLHRDLMTVLEPFERSGGTAEAFVGEDARPRDVKWVSDFRRTSSFRNYQPHITLGHANELPPVTPLEFTADVVALCRLGRFCACRDVISSWRLTGL